MSVTTEILRTYKAPRQVMRRLLASNTSDSRPEARGLFYMILGCIIIFISQIPELVSMGEGAEGDAPLDARLAITFFAWLFIWPLLLYGLATISHILARAFGGKGQPAGARLALFWTVLSVSPLFLIRGLAGMAGVDMLFLLVNAGVALAFCTIWAACLIEAATPPITESVS